MKRCPRCGSNRFIVTAHVVQEWIVDENGMFDSVNQDCICVMHEPADYDLWECFSCGYEAEGENFNVEE